jgi:hypothetical protein
MLISLPVVARRRGSEAFSRAILSSLTSDGINPLCLQAHRRVGTLSSRVLLSCSRCTDLASLKCAYRADCVPLPSIGRGRASTMLSRRRRAPISLDIIIFHNGTRTCLTSTPITRASDIYIPRLALDRVDIKTPDPCKLRCVRVTISPSREKFVGLRLNTTRSPISKRDNPP